MRRRDTLAPPNPGIYHPAKDRRALRREFPKNLTLNIGRAFPLWRNWLKHVLPYLKGPRVLEISFGTGYLLAQYANHFKTYGIDYNRAMAKTAKKNLERLIMVDVYIPALGTGLACHSRNSG